MLRNPVMRPERMHHVLCHSILTLLTLNTVSFNVAQHYSIGLVVPLQDAMSSGARAAFPTLLCYCSAAIVTFFLGLGEFSQLFEVLQTEHFGSPYYSSCDASCAHTHCVCIAYTCF
jgi:hypothetical protein